MAGYRFCRSDDPPLLVEAYNACYRPHFPGLPPLTVAGFKRAVREHDLWSSSCMVAVEDRQPVGVMLAAKRSTENCILAIGVRPDRFRLGHAGHMLESLARKLAILGPPRIVAELPSRLPEVRSLFEKLGYRHERRLVDWTAAASAGTAPDSEALMPVTFHDLAETVNPAEGPAGAPCWARSAQTLANLADELRGFAVGAGDRIEAYLLWRDLDEPPRREVMAFRGRGSVHDEALLGLLFAACRATAGERTVSIPRVAEDEVPSAWLESRGFRAGEAFDRLSVESRL